MKDLDLFSKIGFFIVLIVALAISWWSLYTLAISFAMPMVLAIGVSAAFDGAGLFAAGMTSKYTRNGDNPFFPKTATYLLIGVSALLNVMHADQLNMGIMGMIMFGGASLIAGVIFEIYLRYIHRQVLKDSGRVLDRLPLTGKLAFVFYPKASLRVMKKALQNRLYQGASSVPVFDPSDSIFTETKPKTIKAKAERQDRDSDTSETKDKKTKDIVLVTKPETKMKDMSIAKIVSHLKTQGIDDRHVLREQVSKIKETEVTLQTINKTMSRLNKSNIV